MKNIFATLTMLVISFSLFNSCDSNPVSTKAEKMDIVRLAKTPGYQWYEDELNKYEPNMAIVNQIKDNFDPKTEKICMFVKASCSCIGTQKYFPSLMKTINLAGIPDSCYEVYSMSRESNEHPYQQIYNVTLLPSFFLMKNNIPTYSISDTFNVINAQNPGANVTFEFLLLEALTK